MAPRQTKAVSKKEKKGPDKSSKDKQDRREPAEVRAEEFRIAAQRETVEAFVVAFILALLFRAFLAEAFVIPTGSMAPTLMGAHKDLTCSQCATRFQVGASRERSGPDTTEVVVAGICPNCRYVNPVDLVGNGNHATFNGDRILVSKFAYTLWEPERWDVIVFKYPGNPKQNYIKRLVGLPNETLTIRHGDVYARPTGSVDRDKIVRKPPRKLLAMRQPVYNSDHQSQALIDAKYPCRWQPWTEGATEPPTDSWQIERTTDGMTATVKSSGDARWLRYFHRWPDQDQWNSVNAGGSLANVDPYSSRAITDFYAYGSYVRVPASYVYDERPTQRSGSRLERMLNGGYSKGLFNPRYQSGAGLEQFGRALKWGGQDEEREGLGRDGMHWVGDLMIEADVETSSDSKELILELVEAGVRYQCQFDLSTGKATLNIDDAGTERNFDEAASGTAGNPTADTSVRAGDSYELRLSNCDDQLLLWVDGDVVEFDRPTTFDSRLFRSDAANRPYFSPADPLDAAPAAIGVRGGECTAQSLRVFRDKYYIATISSTPFGGIYDYNTKQLWDMPGVNSFSYRKVQEVMATPDMWDRLDIWKTRRSVTFETSDDQFFPMGDNSPESLDARCWANTKSKLRMPRGVNEDAWTWSDKSYVPRDLLVGKALVVFWPHSWNSPVPFLPNLNRMKLIR